MSLPVVLLPPAVGLVAAAIALLFTRLPWKPRLSRGSSIALIVGLAAAYCAIFSWFGFLHYEAANSHQSDLALMDQLVWTTGHGAFMRTTLQGTFDTFLAYHLEPIMALISPVYLLFPSAGALIVLQTIGMGVSAIPLGLWARQRLGSGYAAVLAALAFLLSPILANNNDLLFEQVPLAVPFLTFAFYFQLQRRWKWFWPCLLLALAVREEIGFVAAGMGLYALLIQRQRIGWAVAGGGLLWAGLALGVVIPHVNHGQGLYWAGSFAYLGAIDTPLTIARNAVTQPLLVIQHMFSPPRPIWVLSLLAPLGFLPLIGWRVAWLALPTLAYLLLGQGYYDPNSWYPDPMLPFLYFGAIEGIAVLRRFLPAAVPATYLAAAAAVSFRLAGVGPGTQQYSPVAYTVTPQAKAAEALAASIPANVGVSATPQIIAHLSHRMNVSIFPELLIPRDVFLIDFIGWRGWHGYPAIYDEYEQALRRVLHDPAYGAFYQGGGLLLLRRGAYPLPPAHPAATLLGGQIEYLGNDAPSTVRAGQPLTVHLRWRTAQALDQQYTVSLQFGNKANGKLAQADSWPWDGYFPTLEWPAGIEIDDPHTLLLPATLTPGQYRLFVSVYSLDHGQAKPLTSAGGDAGFFVGPFTVQP